MERERIDRAIHNQLDRRTYLLRDVVRSGGRDRWSHLRTHGHHFPTILSAIRAGYLNVEPAYVYEITDAGRQYLDNIDAARLRSL